MTEVEVVGTAVPTYTSRIDQGRVIVDVSDADVVGKTANLGTAAARNASIASAQGELVRQAPAASAGRRSGRPRRRGSR